MEQTALSMSFLAQTTDVNYHGNVHGGKVMKWIDEVAYALAVRYAKKNCVTKIHLNNCTKVIKIISMFTFQF